VSKLVQIFNDETKTFVSAVELAKSANDEKYMALSDNEKKIACQDSLGAFNDDHNPDEELRDELIEKRCIMGPNFAWDKYLDPNDFTCMPVSEAEIKTAYAKLNSDFKTTYQAFTASGNQDPRSWKNFSKSKAIWYYFCATDYGRDEDVVKMAVCLLDPADRHDEGWVDGSGQDDINPEESDIEVIEKRDSTRNRKKRRRSNSTRSSLSSRSRHRREKESEVSEMRAYFRQKQMMLDEKRENDCIDDIKTLHAQLERGGIPDRLKALMKAKLADAYTELEERLGAKKKRRKEEEKR
jgi:hypothetical protein